MATTKLRSRPRNINTLLLASVGLFSIAIVLIVWVATGLYMQKKLGFQNEKIKPADVVIAFIAFVAVAPGVISALLAFQSLKREQKAEEGDLYLRMMQRYASLEMKTALRLLGRFYEVHKQDINRAINDWFVRRENGDKEALVLEDARHLVKYFFRDLMQLVQAGYFSKELAKRICNTGGRHLFKNVVLPMDKKINVYYFEGEFSPFENIYAELIREQKQAI